MAGPKPRPFCFRNKPSLTMQRLLPDIAAAETGVRRSFALAQLLAIEIVHVNP